MNVKTTIALVALLAIVGAYLYFFELNSQPPDGPAQPMATEQNGAPLLAEPPPLATNGAKITVDRQEKTTVIKRSDEDWIEVEPVQFPLNNYSINTIVDNIRDLRYTQKFTPSQNGAPSLAEAGLDPPQATLTYHPDAETTLTFQIGRKLLGGHGYITVNTDENVYVVGDTLHQELIEAKPTTWRKKSFDVPSIEQTDQIILTRDLAQIQLHKIDGRWFLDEAATQRAAEDKVKTLADSVGQISVDKFVIDDPEDLKLYGLDNPTTIVQVHNAAEKKAVTLRIGAPADLKDESFFATWSTTDEPSGVIFTLGESKIKPFDIAADGLRSPKIFTTTADDVRRLLITRNGREQIILERDANGWAFASPGPGYLADAEASKTLLDNLIVLESSDFKAPYARPGTTPTAIVEMARGGSGQQRVEFFSDGDGFMALGGGETTGYRFSHDQVDLLFQPVLELRDRTVIDLPADKIRGLVLTRPDAQFDFILDGEQWRLGQHDSFETAAFNQLRDVLSPLKAEGWSLETVDPSISMTIKTTDGDRRILVDPESRRATLTGINATFVLSQDTVDLLMSEYRDRSVLSLAMEDLASVKIDQDDKVMTLRRSADGTYDADKIEDIDQAKAAAMFGALAQLQAASYHTPQDLAVDPDKPYVALILQTTDKQTHRVTIWKGPEPEAQSPTVFGRLNDAELLFTLTDSSVKDFDLVLNPPPVKSP